MYFLSNFKIILRDQIIFQNSPSVIYLSKNSKTVLTIYTLDPLFVLKSNHHHLFQLPPSHQRVSFIRSVNGFFFDRQVVATYWTSRSNIKSHNSMLEKRYKKSILLRERMDKIYAIDIVKFIFIFSPIFLLEIVLLNTLCIKNLKSFNFWIIIII